MKAERTVATALLLVAALLAVGLRGAAPELDVSTRFGSGYLTDEGFYAKNARERISHGAWIRAGDNHNHILLAPGHVALNAVAFTVLGVDIVAARRLSTLAGLVAVALLGFAAHRAAGPLAGALAALFAAVDPGLVHLGRVALAESTLAAGSALLLVALMWRPLEPRRAVLVGGALGLCAVLKGSAAWLVPGVVLTLAAAGRRERAPGRALIATAIAGVVAAAVSGAALAAASRLPDAGVVLDHAFDLHVGRPDLAQLTAHLGLALRTKHALAPLAETPIVTILAGCGVVWSLLGCPGAAPRARALAEAAAAWLVGQTAFLAVLPYQPIRYHLSLGAPAAILATLVLMHLESVLAWRSLPRGRAIALGTTALVAAALVVHQLRGADGRLLSLAIALPLAVALGLVADRASCERSRVGIAAAAVAIALPFAATPLIAPGRTEAAARAAIARHVGAGSTVAGFHADAFTLGTGARTIVIHGPWNSSGDPIARFRVTHLLVGDQEERWIRDRWPELAPRLRPLERLEPAAGARGAIRLFAISGE